MSSSEPIQKPTSTEPEVGFRLDGGNHDLVPQAVIDQLVRSKRIITYVTILSIVGICLGWFSPPMRLLGNLIEIIPLIYLYRFTSAVRTTERIPTWENAALAFRWLKAFWKFMAIVGVIVSCVGLFLILQWVITLF